MRLTNENLAHSRRAQYRNIGLFLRGWIVKTWRESPMLRRAHLVKNLITHFITHRA